MEELGNRFPDPATATVAEVAEFIMNGLQEAGIPAEILGEIGRRISVAERVESIPMIIQEMIAEAMSDSERENPIDIIFAVLAKEFPNPEDASL